MAAARREHKKVRQETLKSGVVFQWKERSRGLRIEHIGLYIKNIMTQ